MLHQALNKPSHFLCGKHKQNLEKNPEQAVIIWKRLILTARKKSIAAQWQEAIVLYGNALEVASIIFTCNPNKYEVNRFIRTSIELIYALRRCEYFCDYSLLITTLQKTLQETLPKSYSDGLLQPMIDIAFSSMNDVTRWMTLLYDMESGDHEMTMEGSYAHTLH